MINVLSIGSCDFHNKNVLLRVDFNVPIKNERICDTTRILKALPTIQYLSNADAKVIISHFGRPKAKDNNLSLKSVVETLSRLLSKEVKFVDDCIGKRVQRAINAMDGGDILLENLRFCKKEEENDPVFLNN